MKKDVCDKSMTFQECELAILRTAIDKAEERSGRETVNSPEVQKIINVVENFLRVKKLVCYGGTAINSILPKQDQFYDKNIELPDYDFFSPHAMDDAKELCDIYVKEGFVEVEGKPGVHEGTYKVFVNFIPVADITYLHKEIFQAIKKDSIRVSGIQYAPPNFLRMSMYLELSRPQGDVSRWEKVLKRLTLLNKNYPLTAKDCNKVDFQRNMQSTSEEKEDLIFETVKSILVEQGCVFFGGYAMSLYATYMPKLLKKRFRRFPDFDVLCEEPIVVAEIVKERLKDIGINNVKINKKPAIGEIVAPHYEIIIGGDTVAFIYEPIACHSYNILKMHGHDVKIATIDTMLSFYLAFLYAHRDYYNTTRILCMSQYLFKVQQENRLKQKGLLRRFTINCLGHQETLEEIRGKKAQKYSDLKNKRGTKEYEEFFLRYRPGEANSEEGDGEVKIKTIDNTIPIHKTTKTTKSKTKTRKNKKFSSSNIKDKMKTRSFWKHFNTRKSK